MFKCYNQSSGKLEITISKNDINILLDFARIAPCDTDTTILMCDLFSKIYKTMIDEDCESIKYISEV